MTTKTTRRTPGPKNKDRLFTLQVFLVSGPVAAKFARKNRRISRTIQIRGRQTLEDLHAAIFDAFDREEEHLYEFQIGGKGPMDPAAKRYGLDMAGNPFADKADSADASKASIASLGLKAGDVFGYWFDFGDDWWHQVNVVAVDGEISPGKYPRVVERVGQSPPQYPDIDL